MIGRVIWITGLSGAGKSTLARELAERLKLTGRAVVVLDGDELRWAWSGEGPSGYDRSTRMELALRYARLASVLSRQDLDVIVATISLFKEVHSWNRSAIARYTEVYLRTPLEELRRRDAKQIYSRHDRGELREIAGLDLNVDEPEAPDLLYDFAPDRGAGALAEQIMLHLQQQAVA